MISSIEPASFLPADPDIQYLWAAYTDALTAHAQAETHGLSQVDQLRLSGELCVAWKEFFHAFTSADAPGTASQVIGDAAIEIQKLGEKVAALEEAAEEAFFLLYAIDKAKLFNVAPDGRGLEHNAGCRLIDQARERLAPYGEVFR